MRDSHRLTPAVPAIAYIGWMMPEDLRSGNPAFSPSGSLFQLNLIQGLTQASGRVPDIISFRPTPTFPRGHEVVVPGTLAVINERLKVRLIPFVNLPLLKQVSVGLVILYCLLTWLWHWRSHPRYVLMYNVYLPQALPALFATWLLGGKPIALVADLPHNLNSQNRGWRRLLHKLNFYLEARSLKHFAALIPVTAQIAAEYAPRLPFLVVEGGLNLDHLQAADQHASQVDPAPAEHVVCMYSGALQEYSGIELLLSAFRRIESPAYQLWIYGRGPLAAKVCEAAQQDARIRYGGLVSHAQILQYQRQATVLINPRPTRHWLTRYTFPSKLFEYMASGRPVINTDLVGVPAEYHQYTLVLKDETAEGLANLIQTVCSRSASDLAEFGQRAREFVVQNKNWTRQGQRIYDFITALPT